MKEISLELERKIEPPPRRSTPREASIHVLVVDDDILDRMAVRRALARSGVDVNIDEATGAVDALSIVPRNDFDCVFLDYHLGDGNGLSVLRGIRGAGLDVPVVMLTSQGDEAVAVAFRRHRQHPGDGGRLNLVTAAAGGLASRSEEPQQRHRAVTLPGYRRRFMTAGAHD